MLAMPSKQAWTTGKELPGRQYDVWVERLNGIFGRWQADAGPATGFKADVQSSHLGSLDIIECWCDPCGASRTQADIGRESEERLVVQLVVSGREYMRLGGQEALLKEGDVFVWDSTQPMQFSVVERLHKISLAMPLQRLKDWMPNSWRALPRWMPAAAPETELIGAFVRTLARTDHVATNMRQQALIEAAVAMLAAPRPTEDLSASQRAGQLELIKQRIRARLHDPGLSLEMLASVNRISLRYLHWLFEGSGQTAWRFIMGERLKRCRADLANPVMGHRSITEIAFSWGFSDTAHFSRRFRSMYAMTASEWRQEAERNAGLH